MIFENLNYYSKTKVFRIKLKENTIDLVRLNGKNELHKTGCNVSAMQLLMC